MLLQLPLLRAREYPTLKEEYVQIYIYIEITGVQRLPKGNKRAGAFLALHSPSPRHQHHMAGDDAPKNTLLICAFLKLVLALVRNDVDLGLLLKIARGSSLFFVTTAGRSRSLKLLVVLQLRHRLALVRAFAGRGRLSITRRV